ncbi:MAG: hypothetical protein NTX64_16100, partial [Elusimicrobia bacterium]|nr:hypothetical protein [Elusimicrobiota bacterium]
MISELDDLDFAGEVTRYIFVEARSGPGPGANLVITAGPANGLYKGGDVVISGGDATTMPGNVILSSAAGNVGIGTANPATKLHMSTGTLTIDGNAAKSIDASGSIISASTMKAVAYYGDGSHLTGLTSAESNTYTSSKTFTGGVVISSGLSVPGAFLDLAGSSIALSGPGALVTQSGVPATSTGIVTSGGVQAAFFTGDGSGLTNLSTSSLPDDLAYSDLDNGFTVPQTFLSSVTVENEVGLTGLLSGTTASFTGSLTVATVSVTGMPATSTGIVVTGGVQAAFFTGDGAGLTNVSADGGALDTNKIWVGDVSQEPQPVAMAGDGALSTFLGDTTKVQFTLSPVIPTAVTWTAVQNFNNTVDVNGAGLNLDTGKITLGTGVNTVVDSTKISLANDSAKISLAGTNAQIALNYVLNTSTALTTTGGV